MTPPKPAYVQATRTSEIDYNPSDLQMHMLVGRCRHIDIWSDGHTDNCRYRGINLHKGTEKNGEMVRRMERWTQRWLWNYYNIEGPVELDMKKGEDNT